jgi:hypothetical protein
MTSKNISSIKETSIELRESEDLNIFQIQSLLALREKKVGDYKMMEITSPQLLSERIQKMKTHITPIDQKYLI